MCRRRRGQNYGVFRPKSGHIHCFIGGMRTASSIFFMLALSLQFTGEALSDSGPFGGGGSSVGDSCAQMQASLTDFSSFSPVNGGGGWAGYVAAMDSLNSRGCLSEKKEVIHQAMALWEKQNYRFVLNGETDPNIIFNDLASGTRSERGNCTAAMGILAGEMAKHLSLRAVTIEDITNWQDGHAAARGPHMAVLLSDDTVKDCTYLDFNRMVDIPCNIPRSKNERESNAGRLAASLNGQSLFYGMGNNVFYENKTGRILLDQVFTTPKNTAGLIRNADGSTLLKVRKGNVIISRVVGSDEGDSTYVGLKLGRKLNVGRLVSDHSPIQGQSNGPQNSSIIVNYTDCKERLVGPYEAKLQTFFTSNIQITTALSSPTYKVLPARVDTSFGASIEGKHSGSAVMGELVPNYSTPTKLQTWQIPLREAAYLKSGGVKVGLVHGAEDSSKHDVTSLAAEGVLRKGCFEGDADYLSRGQATQSAGVGLRGSWTSCRNDENKPNYYIQASAGKGPHDSVFVLPNFIKPEFAERSSGPSISGGMTFKIGR